MNNQPYVSSRFRCELNRNATAQLKDIAEYFENENLSHQLNIVIESLHKALKLDEKETNGISNEK